MAAPHVAGMLLLENYETDGTILGARGGAEPIMVNRKSDPVV